MKFKLEIDMGNATFEDCNGYEIARILKEIAIQTHEEQLSLWDKVHPIRDINGNKVGTWEVTE